MGDLAGPPRLAGVARSGRAQRVAARRTTLGHSKSAHLGTAPCFLAGVAILVVYNVARGLGGFGSFRDASDGAPARGVRRTRVDGEADRRRPRSGASRRPPGHDVRPRGVARHDRGAPHHRGDTSDLRLPRRRASRRFRAAAAVRDRNPDLRVHRAARGIRVPRRDAPVGPRVVGKSRRGRSRRRCCSASGTSHRHSEH